MLVSTVPAHADVDLTRRPLVVAQGRIEAQLVAELNLVNRLVGVPTSFAPDAWYGVTRRLTIGLTYSDLSLSRLAVGGGVCLDGGSGECTQPTRGPNLDVRWSWRDDGALAIAARARFLVRDLDPLKPAVTIGALARWRRGRFAVWSDPYLQIALAKRPEGNRDRIVLPLVAGVLAESMFLVGVRTGWDADVAAAIDGWHVPVALVVHAQLTRAVDLRIEAGFPSLLGPQNDFKQRSALISLGLR
jgi:hypothetical protein